jgi:hypothetical protein
MSPNHGKLTTDGCYTYVATNLLPKQHKQLIVLFQRILVQSGVMHCFSVCRVLHVLCNDATVSVPYVRTSTMVCTYRIAK